MQVLSAQPLSSSRMTRSCMAVPQQCTAPWFLGSPAADMKKAAMYCWGLQACDISVQAHKTQGASAFWLKPLSHVLGSCVKAIEHPPPLVLQGGWTRRPCPRLRPGLVRGGHRTTGPGSAGLCARRRTRRLRCELILPFLEKQG